MNKENTNSPFEVNFSGRRTLKNLLRFNNYFSGNFFVLKWSVAKILKKSVYNLICLIFCKICLTWSIWVCLRFFVCSSHFWINCTFLAWILIFIIFGIVAFTVFIKCLFCWINFVQEYSLFDADHCSIKKTAYYDGTQKGAKKSGHKNGDLVFW